MRFAQWRGFRWSTWRLAGTCIGLLCSRKAWIWCNGPGWMFRQCKWSRTGTLRGGARTTVHSQCLQGIQFHGFLAVDSLEHRTILLPWCTSYRLVPSGENCHSREVQAGRSRKWRTCGEEFVKQELTFDNRSPLTVLLVRQKNNCVGIAFEWTRCGVNQTIGIFAADASLLRSGKVETRTAGSRKPHTLTAQSEAGTRVFNGMSGSLHRRTIARWHWNRGSFNNHSSGWQGRCCCKWGRRCEWGHRCSWCLSGRRQGSRGRKFTIGHGGWNAACLGIPVKPKTGWASLKDVCAIKARVVAFTLG